MGSVPDDLLGMIRDTGGRIHVTRVVIVQRVKGCINHALGFDVTLELDSLPAEKCSAARHRDLDVRGADKTRERNVISQVLADGIRFCGKRQRSYFVLVLSNY